MAKARLGHHSNEVCYFIHREILKSGKESYGIYHDKLH